MDNIEELRKAVKAREVEYPIKYVRESFEYIDKITDLKVCNLLIPSIKDTPYFALFSKSDKKGFAIAVGGLNFSELTKNESWAESGLEIYTDELKIKLSNLYLKGASNTLNLSKENTTYFSGGMVVNIEVRAFSIKPKEKSFYRQIIKIDSLDILRYLECEPFTIKDESFGTEFFRFSVKDDNYSLFLSKWNGSNYLIIDSEKEKDFENFSDDAYSICVALGFFTCQFFQTECWYVESSELNFIEIKNISYTILRDSKKSSYNPIYGNPKSYYRHKELPSTIPNELTLINKNVFAKLCSEILENDKLLGALIIFMEAHNLSVYTRGAAYSVTLETLTQMISEKNAEFKPIANSTLAKEFIAEMQSVLEKFKDNIVDPSQNPKPEFIDSLTILEKKISGLNSPTNKDKLSIPFQLYEINIEPGSDEDKAIFHRNSFLHGYNLRKSKNEYLSDYEVWGVTLHLLNLLNRLILKYIGYSGYMINYAEFHLNKTELTPEKLFLKI